MDTSPASDPPSVDDDQLAPSVVVRRIGAVERQLDAVTAQLAELTEAVRQMHTQLETDLPGLQQQVTSTSAMVDAVAAQVAADTAAVMEHLGMPRAESHQPTPPRREPGLWRRVFGR